MRNETLIGPLHANITKYVLFFKWRNLLVKIDVFTVDFFDKVFWFWKYLTGWQVGKTHRRYLQVLKFPEKFTGLIDQNDDCSSLNTKMTGWAKNY